VRSGVVLFDSAIVNVTGDKTFVSLDAGWASIAGERAFRIGSIHELASDVMWVANLTQEQFYRASLADKPNLRNDSYLRSSLRHIYTELGVDPMQGSPAVATEVLATVLQRTLEYAKGHYDIEPRGRTLNEDFASALGAPRSQIAPDIYRLFEQSASHAYVTTLKTTNYRSSGATLTLRRNRVQHAQELLSKAVPPDSAWQYRSRRELPASVADIETMLEQCPTAFLVQCAVTNVSPLVSEVYSTNAGAKVIRNWLTDVEWRQARQWADIEYVGLLLCTAPSAPIPQGARLPAASHAALSYTCGLIAEQVWTAMTMKRGGRGEESRFTAAAAWFRAMDRSVMFSYAQQLHAKGLTVWGYGGGNVVVIYPEGGLRHALDVSSDMGLVAPASKLIEARRGGELHAA